MTQLKSYKVGVFRECRKSGKYRYSAYLRDYSPGWDGCIEVKVNAINGPEAKKKAIERVKQLNFTGRQ